MLVSWLISLSLSPSLVLFAMKEDNEKVPTLLTDYILKGESCPMGPPEQGFLGFPSPRPPAEGREPAVFLCLPRASCQPRWHWVHGARVLQWAIVRPPRNGVLSLHVAGRPEKGIPSPWRHQSDSTLELRNQHEPDCESSGEFRLFRREKNRAQGYICWSQLLEIMPSYILSRLLFHLLLRELLTSIKAEWRE